MKTIFTLFFAIVFQLSLPAAEAYQISVKQKPGKLRMGVVDEDSIYAQAGFQRNDVVREVNGKKVDDSTPISLVENAIRKGGRIKIERDSKVIELKLKPMPEHVIIDPEAPKGN